MHTAQKQSRVCTSRPAAQRVTHSHTHSLRITANAVESRERRVVHTHSTGDWVHRVVSECAVYSLSPVSTLSSRALSGCGDYALWPMAMGGELSRGRGALGESGVGLAAPGRTLALVSASRATAITASKVSAYRVTVQPWPWSLRRFSRWTLRLSLRLAGLLPAAAAASSTGRRPTPRRTAPGTAP